MENLPTMYVEQTDQKLYERMTTRYIFFQNSNPNEKFVIGLERVFVMIMKHRENVMVIFSMRY